MNQKTWLLSAKLLQIVIYTIFFSLFVSSVLYYWKGIDLNNTLSHVILCPFKYLTGFECPGCGMTRAFISISQLKFYDALKYNFISYPLIFSMVIYLTRYKDRFYALFLKYRLEYLSLIVIFIFWIYRLIKTLSA